MPLNLNEGDRLYNKDKSNQADVLIVVNPKSTNAFCALSWDTPHGNDSVTWYTLETMERNGWEKVGDKPSREIVDRIERKYSVTLNYKSDESMLGHLEDTGLPSLAALLKKI